MLSLATKEAPLAFLHRSFPRREHVVARSFERTRPLTSNSLLRRSSLPKLLFSLPPPDPWLVLI